MNPLILDKLKHLILLKVGIQDISPSDCQFIASEITRKTQKNISETTIKRIFGFATANYQFSKFTLNTLLAFTEDKETSSAVNLGTKENTLKIDDIPSYLAVKSKIISDHTVKKIVENCSIPYEFTINRKFAEHDFDNFYQSKYSFTAFIAQPGYGKSILLSHLVKNSFLNKGAKYENDIILFLQAEKVFNVDNQSLESAIFQILGINTEDTFIDYFKYIYKVSGRRLILIFDNIHTICQTDSAKLKTFNSITQLLINIENNDSIKLVLSMTTYIWRRFFETIRHAIYLKNKWFTGNYYNAIEQANVPVLTSAEINQLLLKVGIGKEKLAQITKSELKYPYNFSFYYQLKDEYNNNEYKSNLIFHQITLKYIHNKIYQSNHSVDKLMLCSQLIRLSNYGKNGEMVNKSQLIPELTKFRTAYIELLVEGILTEEKHNKDGFNTEYIRFIHQNVFEYFLFRELLELHQHKVDNNLLTAIATNYLSPKKYLTLFNWSIYQMIKYNQLENIKFISTLNLPLKEINQLSLFLTETIKDEHASIALLCSKSFN